MSYLLGVLCFYEPVYKIHCPDDNTDIMHIILLVEGTYEEGGTYYEKVEYSYEGNPAERSAEMKTFVLKHTRIKSIEKELASIKKKYPDPDFTSIIRYTSDYIY